MPRATHKFARKKERIKELVMSQQLLVKPLTENAVSQPPETEVNASEVSAFPDFDYRPIPSPRILTVKARIHTISPGKPMRYDFTAEE